VVVWAEGALKEAVPVAVAQEVVVPVEGVTEVVVPAEVVMGVAVKAAEETAVAAMVAEGLEAATAALVVEEHRVHCRLQTSSYDLHMSRHHCLR
jgi:hypothetical protein